MAQATPKCYTPISICALRVTALDASGAVADGPNNSYVTNDVMEIGYSPQIEEGDEKLKKNACGCLVARKRYRDQLKGVDLTLDPAKLEPLLVNILTGGPLLLDGSDQPVAIGFGWPDNFGSCDQDDIQPPVAVEFWQELYDGNKRAVDYPFVRHVYTQTFWSFDDGTANDDFGSFPLKAYSEGNTLWDDPYDDWPDDIASSGLPPLGGIFYDTAMPDASDCDWQSVGS